MAQCGQNKDYASIDVLRRLKYTGKPDYELPSLVSDYWPDKLPVFIRVTCGYCGANAIDFTFASDEMYLVTHVNTQNRVILKDRTGQLLSFPEDHSLKFYTIVNGIKDEKPKQLKDILQEHCMTSSKLQLVPVSDKKIQFYAGPGQEHSMQTDLFEWETSYEERYIVGNSIAFEKLFSTPFVIPIWMPINIDVATGVENEPPEAFDMLMMSIRRIMRNYKNAEAPGNKEVMLFEGKLSDYEEGDYDTIRPSDYASVGSVKHLDVQTIGANLPNKASESVSDNETYDDVGNETPEIPTRNRNSGKETNKITPKKKIYPPGQNVKKKSGIKIPPLHIPGKHKKEKDDDVFSPSGESLGSPDRNNKSKSGSKIREKLDSIFKKRRGTKKCSSESKDETDNRDDDFYETPDGDAGIVSPSGESYFSQRSTTSTQSADTDDDIYEDGEWQKEEDHGNESSDDSREDYELVQEHQTSKKKNSSGYSKTKQVCVVPPSHDADKFYSTCETVPSVSQQSPQHRPLPQIPTAQNNNNNHNTSRPLPETPAETASTRSTGPKPPSKPTVAKKPVIKERTVGSRDQSASSVTNIEGHKEGGYTPDKVEAAYKEESGDPSPYGCYADIPKSVKGLSVKEVSNCLRVLKMPHHVDAFLENDIDGVLLMDMDETMLLEDFNFKRIEASRLLKFIRGWRPEGVK